jgi:hypothetical protein
MPTLLAICRIKNHGKGDIDKMALKNQNTTIKYKPTDNVDDHQHDQWLDSLAEGLCLATHEHIQDKFS